MSSKKNSNSAKKPQSNNNTKSGKSKSGLSAYSYALLVLGISLIFFSFIVGSVLTKTEKPETAKVDIPEEVFVEPTPEVINELSIDPTFSSKSYLLYDLESGDILGGKDIDARVANASTTKVMTALVAVEKYPLNKELTVPESCVGLGGSNVGLVSGETYYVQDLLYGVLLRSASDAVCTLTQNYEGDFIAEMNSKAQELGLQNTQFENAIGFDHPEHFSSSRDLLKLILTAREVNVLKLIMGSRDYTITTVNKAKSYYVQNTNRLLFEVPGSVGYKTGTTSNAGECLIYGYDNFGTELVIVIMGSEDRFSDANQLLEIYLKELNPNEAILPSANPTPEEVSVTPQVTVIPTPVAPSQPNQNPDLEPLTRFAPTPVEPPQTQVTNP